MLSIEHDKAHALILHTVLVGPQHAGRVGFYGAHSVIEAVGTQEALSATVYYVAHHIVVQTTLFLVVASQVRAVGERLARVPLAAVVSSPLERCVQTASAVLAGRDLELRTSPLEVDWTQGAVVTGGFLPSRTYREWGELGLVPSRLRLSVRPGAQAPIVANALGAPLQEGYLRWSGSLWLLPALADGAEGTAAPALAELADTVALDNWFPNGVRRRFGSRPWLEMSAKLPEGGFLARLEGRGPVTATAALDVQLHEGVHAVRGQVETP